MSISTKRIAVIGGGAAGFFAAIAAKEVRPDAHVMILEKGNKPLRKVAISGGGRCNLTNTFQSVTDEKQIYPRGFRLMKGLFKEFDHHAARQWFESHGVPLVIQPDHCLFPRSQDAASVVDCLTRTARRLGVDCLMGHHVSRLEVLEQGGFSVCFSHQAPHTFDSVVVATGGSPRSSHYQWLAEMGHNIVSPKPSLFTFEIADADLRALMGTVVERVVVQIPSSNFRSEGELLVTHWGMSGPAILRLSAFAAPWIHQQNFRFPIAVNWIPDVGRAAIEQTLMQTMISQGRKMMGNACPWHLPSRLWSYMLVKTGIDEQKKWAEVGKKNILRLIETLTNDRYDVVRKGAFRDEFVTCGGVDLSEINRGTLESKLIPGLYFAGEVTDVDGITGGFNLQAAWTMGYKAGKSAVR